MSNSTNGLCALAVAAVLAPLGCAEVYVETEGEGGAASTSTQSQGGHAATTTNPGANSASTTASGGEGAGLPCGDDTCWGAQICTSCTSDDEAEPPFYSCADVAPAPSADQFRCGLSNCDRGTEICEQREGYDECDDSIDCIDSSSMGGCTDCDCVEAIFAQSHYDVCLVSCADVGDGALSIHTSVWTCEWSS